MSLECYHRSAHQATGAELKARFERTFKPIRAHLRATLPQLGGGQNEEEEEESSPRVGHSRRQSADRRPSAVHARKVSQASARGGALASERVQPLSPIPHSVQSTPNLAGPSSPASGGKVEKDESGGMVGLGQGGAKKQRSLARMGSAVTKRLSHLNMSGGGPKAKTSPTIGEGQE